MNYVAPFNVVFCLVYSLPHAKVVFMKNEPNTFHGVIDHFYIEHLAVIFSFRMRQVLNVLYRKPDYCRIK